MNFYTSKQVQAKVNNALKEIKQGTATRKIVSLNGGLSILVRKSSITYQARVKKETCKYSTVAIGDYNKIKLSDAYNQAKVLAEKAKNDALERKNYPYFKDYWKKWRTESDTALRLSKKTVIKKNCFYNGVLHVFDDYRINEITPTLVKRLTSKIKTSQRNLKDCLCTLIACLEQARFDGIIETNSILGYTKQPIFRDTNLNVIEPKQPFKWIEITELKEKLFAKLEDFSISKKVYILLVVLTCSRGGEIREQMTWDRISFKAGKNTPYGMIKIPNSKTKTMRDPDHLDHIIPLTLPLKNLLLNYRKLSKSENSNFLFPAIRNKNKPIPSSSMLLPEKVSAYMHIHGLRKTANTFLVSKKYELGFDEKDIDKVLSHKTDDKIHKTYNKYDYLKEFYRILEFYDSYVVNNCLTDSFKKLVEGAKKNA